jgi:hypothetical protein
MRFMGLGAAPGGHAIVAGLVASCALSCGGQSDRADGEGGPAGIGSSGTGGTDTGLGGQGGAQTAGGLGGIATGGSIGSTGGTGGSGSCPECADEDFRIVIDGHGGPREMAWNGSSVAADPALALCAEQPLRGSVGGCGRTLSFMACAGPMNEPPCLEVRGNEVRSIDEQGGTWSGVVHSDTPEVPQREGVASGLLIVHMNGASGTLVVHAVDYTLCASFGQVLIPC